MSHSWFQPKSPSQVCEFKPCILKFFFYYYLIKELFQSNNKKRTQLKKNTQKPADTIYSIWKKWHINTTAVSEGALFSDIITKEKVRHSRRSQTRQCISTSISLIQLSSCLRSHSHRSQIPSNLYGRSEIPSSSPSISTWTFADSKKWANFLSSLELEIKQTNIFFFFLFFSNLCIKLHSVSPPSAR